MRTPMQVLFVAGALLLGRTTPTWAQDAPVDPRWLPFLGCWESSGSATQWVCVSPAAGGGGDASAVDLVTVADGEVVGRERIAATGERRPNTRDGCSGWESAEWSAHGQRVYLRTEYECAGGVRRGSTGLFAVFPGGEWLRVQGVTVSGQTGLRVLRYREASAGAPIPTGIAPAPRANAWDVSDARLAAAAPVGIGDVIEASHHLDGAVVEAWLAERGEQFASLDAKQLVTLADDKVPERVIDLMVALSYPRAFERRVDREAALPMSGGVGPIRMTDALCYGPYSVNYLWSYDCSSFGYGLAGYDGRWYPGSYPVVITLLSGGGATRAHGRVVNGRGYAQGESAAGPQPATWAPSPPPPSSGASAASSSRTSSTSSSGETRTAKPRPPQ